MKFIIPIFFFVFFISNVQAQKIATFKIFYILENLEIYKKFIIELDEFKKKRFDELKIQENNLINQFNELEKSKILLSENEYFKNASQLNNEKIIFNEKVNKLNIYLQTNIENNERIIFEQVSLIVQDISIEKNFDIVLSDENFFLASELTDISEEISKRLNNKEILLELSKHD